MVEVPIQTIMDPAVNIINGRASGQSSRPSVPEIVINYKPSIIHLQNPDIGQEIKLQINTAISWIYRSRRDIKDNPIFPEDLNQIFKIVPFVYRQQSGGVQEYYCEGETLEDHVTVRKNNGFSEEDAHLYSGFRVSFNDYGGSVLVFNEHSGLSAQTINNLYKRHNMPLSAGLGIILPSD